MSWGQQISPIQGSSESKIQDWRPLMSEKNMSLEFRFINRELEINGHMVVKSTLSRIIEIITSPAERKKWDIRLKEMISIPDGYVFIYSSDRKLYEFHSLVKTSQTDIVSSVEFSTLCYEFKRQNTVLGNFNSLYTAEVVEDANYENRYPKKIKVTWNARFCQNSFELIRGDVFQEADVLKRSFDKLVDLAEFKEEKLENSLQRQNTDSDLFGRKKLRKTFRMSSIR
jgi:hypothetical protein